METKEMQIMNAHGYREQVKKLAEEQFELLESLLDAHGILCENTNHVAEEMADCMVLMEQFRQKLCISKQRIQWWYDQKVARELTRIENAEKNDNKTMKGEQPC